MSEMRFLWQAMIGMPAWLLIMLARGYQFLVSPLLGPCCRYSPTCSAYFIEAVRKHGVLRGTWRGFWRILRCHPFSQGGWDPP